MAETLTSIESNDVFQVWFDTTNQLVDVISTRTVTTNGHANGGLTTGNGFVEGTFGARNLVGNTVHGGTVQTPALLTCTSNLEVTGNKLTVGTVVINSSGIAINGVALQTGLNEFSSNTSGTSTQEVNNFDKIIYRSGEYAITIKDNTANAWQLSKLLVVHDSGNAFYTEYAIVYSNTFLGSFSANANSTHVRVYLTPVTANTTVDGTRVLNDID